MIIVSKIKAYGENAILACDGNCQKAWGEHSRPTIQLSENEDDFAYLADDELGIAPADPGTYEGGCGKPSEPKHNKWCFRECERSSWCGDREIPVLKKFENRFIPQ